VADGSQRAPLCDLARQLQHAMVFPYPVYRRHVDSFALLDGDGGGLWSVLHPVEEATRAATAQRLAHWRLDPPPWSAVLAFEDSLAQAAHALLAEHMVTATPAPAAPLGLTAFPSPFNPVTTLAFDLPRAGRVRLDVHDLGGRLVARLVDGMRSAGPHHVRWQPDALASGVYVARLEAAGAVAHRRLVLVR
jgi:hypothetical protein